MDDIIQKIGLLTKEIKKYFFALKDDLFSIKTNGIKAFILKRKKLLLATVVMLLCIFTMSYINQSLSKEALITKVEESLIEGDSKRIKKYVRVDGRKVSGDDIKPLAEYFKDKDEDVEKLCQELLTKNESGIFIIREDKGFIKTSYYIDVETITVKFDTDFTEAEITLNDKIITNDISQKNIVPGKYLIGYKLKTEFGDVSGEFYIETLESKKIEVDIPATFITLYTNFEDAKVIINNKEVKERAGEIKKFGPIPNDKAIEIYLEREFPWGSIKSDVVNLKNENYVTINLNMANETLMQDINTTLNEFYTSTFQALNKRNIELIVNSSDDVKEKIFQYIEQKYLLFKNGYEITNLNIEIEKSDFVYEDEVYRASIVSKVNYNVFKSLLPFTSKEYESYFLVSLEYKNNKWIVVDIQQFNFENIE